VQLPIESQYIGTIADNLNAEIVLGTVQVRSAVLHEDRALSLVAVLLHTPHFLSGVLLESIRHRLLVCVHSLLHSTAFFKA
jgi:hypothetical protein